MKEEYSFDIKLTLKDMFFFLMKHEYSSFSGLFGLGVSLFAIVGLILGWPGEDQTMRFIYVLIALMFTVLNPIRLFSSAAQQLTKNATFKTAINYNFNAEGIHLQQGEVEASVAWGDMLKLAKGGTFMVLYVSKKVGYIFPKSAVGAEYDELAQFISSHIEAAKAAAEPAEETKEEALDDK